MFWLNLINLHCDSLYLSSIFLLLPLQFDKHFLLALQKKKSINHVNMHRTTSEIVDYKCPVTSSESQGTPSGTKVENLWRNCLKQI